MSPVVTTGFAGVTPIDTSVAPVTVSVVDPDTLPSDAVIVTDPGPTPLTSPLVPDELLTAPRAAFEDAHVTALARFCVVLSV